jgi:mannose-6-phosphate isomerase-like protein (cupin superfamily)
VAKAGKVIESPSTRLVFRQTAADANGQLLRFEQFVRPATPEVLTHVHPRQEERFEVVEGRMGVRAAGHERILAAGEEVVVSPGTPHTFWNAGEDELHQVVELRPALRSETFFETVFGLQRDGKITDRGMPNIFLMAPVVYEYENYLPRILISVQKVLFGALAFVGRLLGYHASYPRYSDDEANPSSPTTRIERSAWSDRHER